jgi:hypothetical protein
MELKARQIQKLLNLVIGEDGNKKEENKFSFASQDIPRVPSNPKLHYHVHKGP